MKPPDKVASFREMVIWILLVCLNACVPITTIWEFHTGKTDTTAALLAGGVVLVFFNVVILLAFYIRSKREGWPLQKRLVIGAGVLAAVSFLFIVLGVASVKQRNEYSGLVSSDVPLSSIQPERKRLLVELMRRTLANTQEENKFIAEAQKVPMNPAVYSPESFANQQVIQSTVAHLATYTEVDLQYSAKLDSIRGDFRRKMATCDPEFLKEWDAKQREQQDREKSAVQLEHDWFSSVKSLYDYADKHSSEINVKSGHISIPSDAVRQTFNDLFGQSKALHNKLQSAVQQELKLQQQAKARIAD